MSLINKVLKDLDANRQKTVVHDAAVTGSGMSSGQAERSFLHYLVVFVGLILFIAILIFGIYKFWPSKMFLKLHVTKPKQTQAVSVKIEPVAKTVIPTQQVEAATLDDIKIQGKDQSTVVTFTLSEVVHYSIHHGADHSKLFLTLTNTRLSSNLVNKTPKAGIQSMTYTTKNNQVVIDMTLIKDAGVSQLDFVKKGAPAELQLVLHHPKIVETESAQLKKTVVPLTPDEQAQTKYQKALELIEGGRTGEAIPMLNDALELSPNNTKIRESLAALLIQSGQVSQAKKVLSEGLAIQSDYAPYIMMQARILVSQGLPQRALSLLQESSPAIRDYPDYYALMAALYQKMGQYLTAARLYNQLVQVQSDNSIWWVGMGVAFESAGKRNAAIEAYHRALEGQPLPPNVRAFVEDKVSN